MFTLTLQQISKSFPGVKALDGVELKINPGEVHAVCGENGAGKSTLMNIITGNHQPDSGKIMLNGSTITIPGPQAAFGLGIAIVYQHLSLVDSLSVAENIYANQQPVNRFGIIRFDKLNSQTRRLLEPLGLADIDPETRVFRLSQAQKQMIEIAKALSRNPSLLVLDEPTASLTEKETAILFTIVRRLRSEGKAILYISHRLEEIFELADRVSILKDGKPQGTFGIRDIDKRQLIAKMVGRDLESTKRRSFVQDEKLLEVNDLSGIRFRNISFTVHKGEILGFAGLIGAGRTEIARAIFGAGTILRGKLWIHGHPFEPLHPRDAVNQRIAYVPEDRKSLGLFQYMDIRENIIAANLKHTLNNRLYSAEKAAEMAKSSITNLRIATPGIHQKAINLSGGNQQKVVLAKWLWTHPDLLIVDEPTHGIDVGAKYEIYEILRKLASEGKGILVISSDLPELIGICDRILVLREGTIAGELDQSEVTEEKIMSLAAN